MQEVSVIICAYNEEKTIKDVVVSISEELIVGEIIVVNDGSTDTTKEIINTLKDEYRISAIHLSDNMGKGYAMAIGVEKAIFDIIVFIDADQRKIPKGYIDHLVIPILTKECDMVLGYSTVNILNKEVNPLKILTGERALYKKDLMPILEKMKVSRFGVETILFLYYQSINKTLKFTHLEGLKHNDKFKKMSSLKATTSYLNEGLEIASTALKNHDLLLKAFNFKLKNDFKTVKLKLSPIYVRKI